MPYEVPLNVVRESGNLEQQLLDPAFAEQALSCVICLPEGFHRMEFAHSHQFHTFGKGGTYGGDIVGNGHYCTTFIL